jgi:hypothetical protein
MKVVAWNHKVMAMIRKANFKIIKKEVLHFKILVLTNSKELIKQVLCHNLKNNHLGQRSIDRKRKVKFQMLLTVSQELFRDFQGLPIKLPNFLD